MSDDDEQPESALEALRRAMLDPELKPFVLADLKIFTAPELSVVMAVRAVRRPIGAEELHTLSGYNLPTVERALDQLASTGWVKQVNAQDAGAEVAPAMWVAL